MDMGLLLFIGRLSVIGRLSRVGDVFTSNYANCKPEAFSAFGALSAMAYR
jgi:hypothetical protein